jgi:hypothetical protein
MNKMIKFSIPGALLMAGLLSSYGQGDTNVAFTVTNVLMDLKVKAVIYEQTADGQVTQHRIINKDIINQIATDQGLTVSKKSKLVVAVPIGASEADVELPRPEVRIQNGTDMNSFTVTSDNLNLFETSTIEGGTTVKAKNAHTETDYGVWQMSFATASADFEATGFANFTITQGTKPRAKGTIAFAGNGHSNGNAAVVKGTATTSGKNIVTTDVSAD